jgi:hypothetical protein
MLKLLSTNDTKQIELLAIKMGELEKERQTVTFEHFRKVRTLCNDRQKKKFDIFIQQILQKKQ